MGTKIPLFFEYDLSTITPSSIAEFTASDVISAKNGGTGVSSLAALGTALQGYDVSAKSLSSMTIVAVDLSATNLSAGNGIFTSLSAITTSSTWLLVETGVSSLNVSATNIYAESGVSSATVSATYMLVEGGVSSTALSATTITGAASMPLPAPWAYAYTAVTVGTPSDTEQNIGVGSTVNDSQSSTDDFEWDDANKRWDVKKAGTYEITANVILTVDATTDVTLQIYTTYPGSAKYSAITRIHSAIDPRSTTITYIGTIAAGMYAYVTTLDDGATDVTVEIGTTITVKRLL